MGAADMGEQREGDRYSKLKLYEDVLEKTTSL